MLYGSSPYLQKKFRGAFGPTGPTGFTGPVGPTGAHGGTGQTGATGPSISGMTNSSNVVITTFDDNVTTRVGSEIKGNDGDYYVFADGQNASDQVIDIFAGVSASVYDFGIEKYTVNTLNFRGLTTASRKPGLNIISINPPSALNTIPGGPKDIVIDYTLVGLPFLGLSGGSTGQLVVAHSANRFGGLTGTEYDVNSKTVNLQTINYGERVKYVRPVKIQSDSNNTTAGFYFYWYLDWEEAPTFVLNSFTDQLSVGQVVTNQIIVFKNADPAFAKAITIVVPPGITGKVATKYISTNSNSYVLGGGENNISWPLTYPPCFTEGLDVINAFYIEGIWHANYGMYNSGNEQISWNKTYNNCAGSIEIDDPVYDPVGLCCVGCSAGTSFVTVRSGCQSLVSSGNAYFFPHQNINYPGCTANGDPIGYCCYKNSNDEIVTHPSPVRSCDCLRISRSSNQTPWSHWTLFDNCNRAPGAVDCAAAYNETGSCCNGSGGCQDNKTRNECIAANGYWQGVGTVCGYTGSGNFLYQRCLGFNGATAGCCVNGNCTNRQRYGDSSITGCTGIYYGCGFTCGSFICEGEVGPTGGTGGTGPTGPPPPTQSNCPQCYDGSTFRVKKYNPVTGIFTGQYTELNIGDFFAGGIVAGVFRPSGTTCLGNADAFGGQLTGITFNGGDLANVGFNEATNPSHPLGLAGGLFNQLNNGNEKTAQYYRSFFDDRGYGFTLPKNSELPSGTVPLHCESWLLIVLPFPARIKPQLYENSISGIENYYADFYTNEPIEPDTSTVEFSSLTPTPVDKFQMYERKINLFTWSHGGTSHCFTLATNLKDGHIVTQGTDLIEPINCQAIGVNLRNDGFYGTLPKSHLGIPGTTYWGNSTTFDFCWGNQINPLGPCLENCWRAPCKRTRLGKPNLLTSNTGYWARNWGMYNCTRLFSSDAAEYYLRAGSGMYTELRSLYGATGHHPTFGFTANFRANGQHAKTTIAEGTSVYNRKYYTVEEMGATGYPQVSRWFVPSIDELSFIANQCVKHNLQEKIYNYQVNSSGLRSTTLGDIDSFSNSTNKEITFRLLGGAGGGVGGGGVGGGGNPTLGQGIPIGSAALGANGWVWSSTGCFDVGNTKQYIQATGGVPKTNDPTTVSVTGPDFYQVNTHQFTKAWALKFPAFDTETQSAPVSTDFKVKKGDDFYDKYELRLVRLIRCDQRYYGNEYNNTGYEICANRMWHIPRLTDGAIVNGTNANNEQYNASNFTSDPQWSSIIANIVQT